MASVWRFENVRNEYSTMSVRRLGLILSTAVMSTVPNTGVGCVGSKRFIVNMTHARISMAAGIKALIIIPMAMNRFVRSLSSVGHEVVRLASDQVTDFSAVFRLVNLRNSFHLVLMFSRLVGHVT